MIDSSFTGCDNNGIEVLSNQATGARRTEQNPNEPSPLRRLLSLIETNELRPATKLIFAGGPRLRIPFAPPVCPSQQGPADDVGRRRGLWRRSGPGSGREKAEQRRPAGEG